MPLNIFGSKPNQDPRKKSARVHPSEDLKPVQNSLPQPPKMSDIEIDALRIQKEFNNLDEQQPKPPAPDPRKTMLIQVQPAPNKFDVESEKLKLQISEKDSKILEKQVEIKEKQENLAGIANQLSKKNLVENLENKKENKKLQNAYEKAEEIRKSKGILSLEYREASKKYQELSSANPIIQKQIDANNELSRLQQAQADLSAQKASLVQERDAVEGGRYFDGMTDVEKKMLYDSQKLNAQIDSKTKELEALNSMFGRDEVLKDAYQDFNNLKKYKKNNGIGYRFKNLLNSKDKELADAKAAYDKAVKNVTNAKNEKASAISEEIKGLAKQKDALDNNLQKLYEKRLDGQMAVVDVN